MQFTHLIGRKPFLIGAADDPQTRRWWVIPKNKSLNIYLHHWLRGDDGRACHTHAWVWNASIILWGRYLERFPDGSSHTLAAPAISFRRGESPHLIEMLPGETAWSLFITGRVVREWGFLCPQGWRHNREFTQVYAGGNVRGTGCE